MFAEQSKKAIVAMGCYISGSPNNTETSLASEKGANYHSAGLNTVALCDKEIQCVFEVGISLVEPSNSGCWFNNSCFRGDTRAFQKIFPFCNVSTLAAVLILVGCAGAPSAELEGNSIELDTSEQLVELEKLDDSVPECKTAPARIDLYPTISEKATMNAEEIENTVRRNRFRGGQVIIRIEGGQSVQFVIKMYDKNDGEMKCSTEVVWSIESGPEREEEYERKLEEQFRITIEEYDKWGSWSKEVAAVDDDGVVTAASGIGGSAVLRAEMPSIGISRTAVLHVKGPIVKTLCDLDVIEITNDEHFTINKKFNGRAYLLFNRHNKVTLQDLPKNLPLETRIVGNRIGVESGDDFSLTVFSSFCPVKSGGLVISWRLLIDENGTHAGLYSGLECLEATRRFWINSHYSVSNRDGSEIECKKSDCKFMYDKRRRRYTFDFDAATVEVNVVREFCGDSTVHRVIIKDEEGGILQVKDMLNFMAFEYDGDGDGARELYIISTQDCGRWLKVIKIVAD